MYVAGTAYSKRDLVYYNGNTYYALLNSINVTPSTVSTSWQLMATGNAAVYIATTTTGKTVQDKLDEYAAKIAALEARLAAARIP